MIGFFIYSKTCLDSSVFVCACVSRRDKNEPKDATGYYYLFLN